MMSLDEAIKHAEYIVNNRKDAISVCWSANDNKQLAAWLRELQERRAAPEIIRCSECIYRYVEGNHVRFNRCELNHNNVQSDDWYCADAERRTDK